MPHQVSTSLKPELERLLLASLEVHEHKVRVCLVIFEAIVDGFLAQSAHPAPQSILSICSQILNNRSEVPGEVIIFFSAYTWVRSDCL
jgi:hypothetical protein